MKSPEDILALIALRIGHIYFRPMLYGETAETIDQALFVYHSLWVEIAEGSLKSFYAALAAIKPHALSAPSFYKKTHKDSDENAVRNYVINHWRSVSKRLGIKIPYAEIREQFKDKPQLRELFLEEN